MSIPKRRALTPERVPLPGTTRSRMKALPELPPEMQIPYRAKPEEPGKVVLFYGDAHLDSPNKWRTWQASSANLLSRIFASELSSTRIALEEGDYKDFPSTLVISTGPLSSDSQITSNLYGFTDDEGKELFFDAKAPLSYRQFVFSDADMLSAIEYDVINNIHLLNPKNSYPEMNEEMLILLIQTAQKYFDFVVYATTSSDDFKTVKKRVVTTGSYQIVSSGNKSVQAKPIYGFSSGDNHEYLSRTIQKNPLIWYWGNKIPPGSNAVLPTIRSTLAQRVIRDLLTGENVKHPELILPDASEAGIKKGRLRIFADAPVTTSVSLFCLASTPTMLMLPGPIEPLISLLTGGVATLLSSSAAVSKASAMRNHRARIKLNQFSIKSALEIICAEDSAFAAYPVVNKPSTTLSVPQLELPKILGEKKPSPPQGTTSANADEESSQPGISKTPPPALTSKVLSQRIKKLANKWMSYELDPMKTLDYPLMMDVSCPETREFVQSYETLIVAQKVHEEEKTQSSLKELHDALAKAESDFLTAENNAKKMRLAHLDADQKKQVNLAKNLTAIALDENASPHERVSAWRKASDCLEGILYLPDRAVKGLLAAAPC